MAGLLCAEAEEADRVVCQAQRDLPTECQSARGEGDRDDPTGPTWLGELFPDRRFESMFLGGRTMGREEDPAASDASQRTQGHGLEAVERNGSTAHLVCLTTIEWAGSHSRKRP